MSASRSWGVKPYRVFPPTCRYRQWPPPQIAVPGSLRLPMILLAFRSHPVVCFPPSKEGFKALPASPRPGSGYGSHPTEEGRKVEPTGSIPRRRSCVSIPQGRLQGRRNRHQFGMFFGGFHPSRTRSTLWRIRSPILCRGRLSRLP